MRYVFLTNNIVTDMTQVDPHMVFEARYADQFIQVPGEVTFGWKLENGRFIPPPAPKVNPNSKAEENKAMAIQLLAETDWTEVPSVYDKANILYLKNHQDFVIYRVLLRDHAIHPTDEVVTWPTKPTPVWSK